MPEEKFVFDSLQDPQSIAEFIQTLREGFESSRILLATDGEEIVLNPKGLLNFSVKAKKKSGESKLTIKIGWKERGDGITCSPGSPIRIEK